MKLFNLFTILVIGLLSFSSQAQHTQDKSLIAKGARLYSENCGRCHNPRPASDYSKKEWSVVMPHMREKAHMTGKESLAVEAFLDSTLTSDVRSEMKSSSADRPQLSGQALIDNFGCQGCHQVRGSGGNLGPALDNVVATKGKAFVLKKLKNPKFNNAASAMPKFPMSQDDMEAIIDYISKK
ncbi:MAG TPA: cytochrome c [Aeromonadales bacterium]|nr:cytochrome c [Aeromonadales bacterium]